MTERTKLVLMMAALVWALVVSVALVWALVVSVANNRYGFGLGFAIILAGLVVAIALVTRDAITDRPDPDVADHQRQSALTPAAADRVTGQTPGNATSSDEPSTHG